MPNFFAMGYYLTFANQPLPQMEVEKLNVFLRKYLDDTSVQREVVGFIRDRAIKGKDVYALASAFPSKTTRNIIESGIINEFA